MYTYTLRTGGLLSIIITSLFRKHLEAMASSRNEGLVAFARAVVAASASTRRQWLCDFYSTQDSQLQPLLEEHLLALRTPHS